MHRSIEQLRSLLNMRLALAGIGISVAVTLFALSLASAGDVPALIEFKADTTAMAEDVNENFRRVEAAINLNHSRVDANRDLIDANETSADHAVDIAALETSAAHAADVAVLETSADHDIDIAAISAMLLPVGTVLASLLSEEEFHNEMGHNWDLAAGQNVAGSAFETLTGMEFLPDMRGRFLRGMGHQDSGNAGLQLGDAQEDATALPNAGFLASDDGAHSHDLPIQNRSHRMVDGNLDILEERGDVPLTTLLGGTHAHAVTGGDDETRPVNVTVNYFIRVD